jgi:hypothetical protein
LNVEASSGEWSCAVGVEDQDTPRPLALDGVLATDELVELGGVCHDKATADTAAKATGRANGLTGVEDAVVDVEEDMVRISGDSDGGQREGRKGSRLIRPMNLNGARDPLLRSSFLVIKRSLRTNTSMMARHWEGSSAPNQNGKVEVGGGGGGMRVGTSTGSRTGNAVTTRADENAATDGDDEEAEQEEEEEQEEEVAQANEEAE